ncbi:3' exoribonuclease family protein [Beauveria bassiana ARSEF 2860]|uniref:Exosome complex component RRP45 n=1 Tax=Beauveria bassiana (strain ARSEF 2860) TaxID=655819 RepID=J4WH64_BEAB2|nr:3' exoribonuclease family protein [Beauveria bassiana ARSEF 2860]EJP69215.1 3' exoribonuclease family protein [Beauveria bassiana ARSEF 2860]
MPREVEPSLSEKTFVTQALAEGLRLDNRTFEQYRSLKLTFGDEYGIAEVQLGKTKVLAKVSAEVTVPFSDRPFDGVFTIASELSPMAAPSFEVNRPTETEVILSRLLEKTIRRSGALDTESLCLIAGQKCWSVRVDLHVLAHEGNLLDTSCLAVVAALRHFRKPETTMEGGVLTVYTPAERVPVPLSWLHSPFCVTFSFFGGNGDEEEEKVLLDTTWLEEQLRTSSCTFSMNRHGEICQISKLGGDAVDAPLFVACAQRALGKTKEFTDLVDRELAEDAKRRDKGGLMAELTAENER